MRTSILSCVILAASFAAHAIEPMPKEEGLKGYVAPGLSVMQFRDNTLAGTGALELGEKRINSLDSKASEETAASISIAMEIGYMFTEPELYLYFGNRLEDYLRLDNSTEIGARMDLGLVGLLEGGVLFSPTATKVWEDPFLTGAKRKDTDRTSSGGRLGLADIFGSGFEVSVTARKVEVDQERSGASLGLSGAERDLLVRDGESARIELLYPWKINDQHTLIPSVSAGVYDADGDAVAREGGAVQLTHVFTSGRLRLISNLAFRQASYEEENPVFGLKQDEEEVIASVNAIYGEFLGAKELALTFSLLFAERDSDITFYDAEAIVGTTGLMYFF